MQLLQDVKSALFRQHHIEQNYIRLAVAGALNAQLSIDRSDYLKAFKTKPIRVDPQDMFVVFN